MELEQKFSARPYHDLNSPFSVDERGAFAEYIIHDPNKMPSLALGATIVIRDKRENSDVWIAGKIVGLKSISPFNPQRQSLLYHSDETYNPNLPIDQLNGPHTHQPMIIRVELTREMINKDDNSNDFISSAIQRPPSAASRLIFPNVTAVKGDASPSLEQILDIKQNGLELGMVGFGNTPYESNNSFLTYRWDIDNLDNKHIFIVGESESGKTVLLKNLAFQIRKHNKNNRVILTDVQGDISQLLLWNMDNILTPRLTWQKKVKTMLENSQSGSFAKEYLAPFQLVIPKIRIEDQDTDIVALKKLANMQGVVVKEISLRLHDLNAPSDVEYLYRISSPQVAGLLDDIAEDIRNRGEKITIERLDLALNRLLSRNTGATITLTTNGLAYYRSTFEAARRALFNLKYYFDKDQDSLKTEQNPFDVFKAEGTTILYLDHLNLDERLMWEMQLVKWLYEQKKEMSNTYVFFDEAHQIIPSTEKNSFGSPGVFERLRSNFEKLAREGRKFRINLILSTQNPKDLHEIVPEQCPTRIVMKINPKNAKYAYLDDGLEYIANSFGQGQFWIQSPFNGTPDWVRVHSIAPPLPHEPMESFRKNLNNKINER